MELIEQKSIIKSIVRQGDREVIVTLNEFPFNWQFLKAEVQSELNQRIEDYFKVLLNRKVMVYLKGGNKRK